MRGLDAGLGRLGETHHAGEGGGGDETSAEVTNTETDDGEVEHDVVPAGVTDWIVTPAVDDDELSSDGDDSEDCSVEHQ